MASMLGLRQTMCIIVARRYDGEEATGDADTAAGSGDEDVHSRRQPECKVIQHRMAVVDVVWIGVMIIIYTVDPNVT